MAQTHISPLNQNYVTEFDLLVQPKVIQTEIVTMATICIYFFFLHNTHEIFFTFFTAITYIYLKMQINEHILTDLINYLLFLSNIYLRIWLRRKIVFGRLNNRLGRHLPWASRGGVVLKNSIYCRLLLQQC